MLSILTAFTLALTLVTNNNGVYARDDRILVEKPSCQTMENFQANFLALCPVFIYDGSATYQAEYFRIGNFSGENSMTEATAYCSYTFPNGTVNLVTEAVVTQLGGSVA